MRIFDSHAHYDDEQFNEDRDELLSAMKKNNVAYILNVGCDYNSSVFTSELANQYDFIYAAVGIHPHDAQKNEDVSMFEPLCSNEKVVAIGEIGLDYYYDFSPRDIQIKYFEEQLQLANKVDLPIIVHSRKAHADTLTSLKKIPVNKKGVIHCYSGSKETARELLNMGYYLGFGGAITFANARKTIEVLEYVPLDRILIETDCPYLSPVPFRGKRNNSMYLTHVIDKISEIKGISREEIADITLNNAKQLFGIDR